MTKKEKYKMGVQISGGLLEGLRGGDLKSQQKITPLKLGENMP